MCNGWNSDNNLKYAWGIHVYMQIVDGTRQFIIIISLNLSTFSV